MLDDNFDDNACEDEDADDVDDVDDIDDVDDDRLAFEFVVNEFLLELPVADDAHVPLHDDSDDVQANLVWSPIDNAHDVDRLAACLALHLGGVGVPREHLAMWNLGWTFIGIVLTEIRSTAALWAALDAIERDARQWSPAFTGQRQRRSRA